MTKCNLCHKDFHEAELTTLNQVVVCKICKVRALQKEFRATCIKQGGEESIRDLNRRPRNLHNREL